ncbi:hypothetical protein Syn7502_02412 [Synechococcus sp. PCC 7502]|uniref:DUF305 domain-containing protein n=1 Tax=Synechococcus sp. PCC 7502 TaxID=1173263 RepID=UPI00029FDCD3|nr:DUF305 domain-containing protein [Synechococcus sp. PCC 7502]AFY74397.1 hypothetical protein Syn7502_02412 [Synechococcus sp. PCC 7502]
MKLTPYLFLTITVTAIIGTSVWQSSAQMNKMMNHNMDEMSMELGAADANLDLRFIDAMIPHHQGAVQMAKEALKKSKRPEIQKLATAIIKAQQEEIAQLQKWRKLWYPNMSSTPMAWHGEMGHMMTMSASQQKAMMMSMDLGAGDAKFDLRFIDAMIPHHEGALTMAQEALSKSKRPEIQKLAKAIITSQKAEIIEMQKWRKAWY